MNSAAPASPPSSRPTEPAPDRPDGAAVPPAVSPAAIARTSRRLALAFKAVALALALLAAALVAGAAVRPGLVAGLAEGQYFPGASIATGYQLWALVAMAVTGLGLAIGGLVALGRMFDAFAGADPLTGRAAAQMRRAGQWFLAATAFSILIQAPASAIASWTNAPGERFVAIALSSDQAIGLLAAAALIALARIQALAAEVRADQRQIV